MGLDGISAWQLVLIFILLVLALIVAFIRPADSTTGSGEKPGDQDTAEDFGENDTDSPPRSSGQ